MKIEIRICGLGGQGVVLAGQILGRAAVYDGKNAVQTQSYGAEARGGIAKSEIIISDTKIGFPAVRKCDVLVSMTQETLDKYVEDLKENGILLVDSGLIKNMPRVEARLAKLPITETTEKAVGEKMYANIVMLGTLNQIGRLVSDASLERAIEYAVPKKALEVNLRAYKAGKKLASSLEL
jgi:2-oxoglutarate ferredoxin oxidoreductase subunit gamma